MPLSFEMLQTYNALYELRSHSKTAKKLQRSQPTVSYRLKQLTKEIGFDPFVGGDIKLGVTDRGEEFYRLTARVMNAMSALEEFVDEVGYTRLRLGVTSCIEYACAEKLAVFLEQVGQVVSISILEDTVDGLIRGVDQGYYDAAYICSFDKNVPYRQASWAHRLRWAASREVDIDALLTKQQIPTICWREPWHPEAIYRAYFDESDHVFTCVYETSSYASFFAALRKGIGIGVINDFFCDPEVGAPDDELMFVGLPDLGPQYIHRIARTQLGQKEVAILNAMDSAFDQLIGPPRLDGPERGRLAISETT